MVCPVGNPPFRIERERRSNMALGHANQGVGSGAEDSLEHSAREGIEFRAAVFHKPPCFIAVVRS